MRDAQKWALSPLHQVELGCAAQAPFTLSRLEGAGIDRLCLSRAPWIAQQLGRAFDFTVTLKMELFLVLDVP